MDIKVEDLVNDTKFVKHVINRCIPIHKMYEMVGAKWSYEHNVYCQFHDNSDTPSARMFKNKDGTTTLFCYAEQKVYRPSDFITKELINFRLENVFSKIWSKLNSDQREVLLNSYNNDVDYIPSQWTEALHEMELFKKGDISINELRTQILKATL